MSGTFDPWCDAMESLWGREDNEYDPSDFDDYQSDKLYYHTPYNKHKVVTTTDKATLLEGPNGQFWYLLS